MEQYRIISVEETKYQWTITARRPRSSGSGGFMLRIVIEDSICKQTPVIGEILSVSVDSPFLIPLKARIENRWYFYYDSSAAFHGNKMGIPPDDETVKLPCQHPQMARYAVRGGKQGCYTCSEEW